MVIDQKTCTIKKLLEKVLKKEYQFHTKNKIKIQWTRGNPALLGIRHGLFIRIK